MSNFIQINFSLSDADLSTLIIYSAILWIACLFKNMEQSRSILTFKWTLFVIQSTAIFGDNVQHGMDCNLQLRQGANINCYNSVRELDISCPCCITVCPSVSQWPNVVKSQRCSEVTDFTAGVVSEEKMWCSSSKIYIGRFDRTSLLTINDDK